MSEKAQPIKMARLIAVDSEMVTYELHMTGAIVGKLAGTGQLTLLIENVPPEGVRSIEEVITWKRT